MAAQTPAPAPRRSSDAGKSELARPPGRAQCGSAGSTTSWPGLTRISAVPGRSAPSSPGPWSAGRSGSLPSRSPTGGVGCRRADRRLQAPFLVAHHRQRRRELQDNHRRLPRPAGGPCQGAFDDVLEQLAEPSYEEDGILFGPFYDGNEGTALYNSNFRPFQSPVPFLFVRHTVLSDWKFFVEDDALLDRWARRFGPSGTAALGEALRRLSWRTPNDAA